MAEDGKEVELTKTETHETYSDLENSPIKRPSGRYTRLSSIHARSFTDPIVSGKVISADEYGNKFMALNLKGRPVKDSVPFLQVDLNSPWGVRTNGMCVEADIDQTEDVSKFMRRHGLATEKIRKKSKIEKIEIKGKTMTIPELKEMLLKSSRVDHKTAKEFLDQAEFYEIEREMPVDERIMDLDIANADPSKFKQILAEAFKYLKLAEGMSLDIKNDDDIRNYLSQVLPQRMGNYLGRFHDLGLSHEYPDDKNWIIIGALVDLDSVDGAPFGGDPQTDEDVDRDLGMTVETVQGIFMEAYGKYSGFVWSLWENDPQKIESVQKVAVEKFLEAYVKARGISRQFVNERYPEVQKVLK